MLITNHLIGENILNFDKFHDHESRNYFPSAGVTLNFDPIEN